MTTPRQLAADPEIAPALHGRARELARLAAVGEQEDQTVTLLFRLGADHFSLPANAAYSVRPLERFTPLPATPAWLLGLVNVRGRLLAAVDLRPLLKLPAVTPRAGAMLVIIGAHGVRLGLLADEVIGVQHGSRRLAPQPSDVPDMAMPWILGVDEALSLHINPALLIADPRLIIKEPDQAAPQD